jgi:DNA polymerase
MSALTDLNKEIDLCRQCEIVKTRTKSVPGEGAENAEIMLIGEAPGWNEDQQGRPFIGAAGQFLDELLASINLKRPQVYIANVIKCRPPENRDPLPTEIVNCSKFLDRQIELISPKIIVTLGRHSMSKFFPGKTIGKIHGTWETRNGVIYFAMYHPAAALHQGNLRAVLKQDILKLPPLLEKAKPVMIKVAPAPMAVKAAPKEAPPARQISMF